jgi:hypothetical protein
MSKYIFNIYSRNEFGDHIPSDKRVAKVVRANVITARDFVHRKYPKSFIELESVEI